MSKVQSYKTFIYKEKRIASSTIKPFNVYRISLYDYSEGGLKSLSGNNSSLVFVFGIFDKKIESLKISEAPPEIFFRWLRTVKNPRLTEQEIENSEGLKNILIKSNPNGSLFFSSYIKGSSIYKYNPNLYRSYNISGIKYISEVQFKKDNLKYLLL